MLGGLIWSLTSCSEQGKEASSLGGAPAAPRPGALIKPARAPEGVGGLQPIPALEGGWET